VSFGTTTKTKSVLITGVSTGIGLGMTRKLLAEGYRVFGSVRSSRTAEELKQRLGENYFPLVFDVCKQEEVDGAARTLQDALSGQHLTALINNAGSAEIGPLLHVPPEDLARQLDVLVVGQLRVIQAFYKFLLRAGGTPGRIINISSVSGVGANTYFGCYAAGKHALEGLSKTLRQELRASGVKVVVIAPGNIATDIWPKQTAPLIERYAQTDYYPGLERTLRQIGTDTVKGAMSVEEFSRAFYEVFTKVDPGERYTIVKRKRRRIPLSRHRVRVIEG
jgi:NAD(P)-dependent dehydrogenase (short-subunit alcohol dehydrogenase family)